MYSVEIGSGGMMYLPGFIEIGPGIQKSLEENAQTDKKTHRGRKAISKLVFIFIK
jgi:hypothetical protein